MLQYVFIIIWIAFMYLISSGSMIRKENVLGKNVYRATPFLAILTFIPIIYLAAFRDMGFGDTWGYYRTYQEMPLNWSEISEYMTTRQKDKGFYFFSAALKLLFAKDCRIYFLTLALIQGVSLMTIFRRYSGNFLLSVFLFVASTDYYSWMYNGIRQFTAVTIVFAATALMLKKKYVLLLIVILIASTFHQSALLMIPFVIISQGKAWNKRTVIFIGIALVAVFFVEQFTEGMNEALSNTQYGGVVSDYTNTEDDGTNPIRVMVYLIPAVLSFWKRKDIQNSSDKMIHLCVNMSIISAGLYLISMVTSGIYLGRLPIYASLYGYILLPWEIDNMFDESSKALMCSVMIGCYLLFFYYQMHFTWGLL